MNPQALLRINEIERRVCDIASVQLGISRDTIALSDRLIEDLHCDSLDLVELFIELEESFCVTLPSTPPNNIYKAVFTRSPVRLSDLAELVYLQQGAGASTRPRWYQARIEPPPALSVPFSQLDGCWRPDNLDQTSLFEPLSDNPAPQYRRRPDGMRCVLIPGAEVELGSEAEDASPDERPIHRVEIDSFLIDVELVSTTAFCRFLNSVGEATPTVLADWFVLRPEDHRNHHMLIENIAAEWRPVSGAEKWPMILVSWQGANAYSLWANGREWSEYRDENGTEFGSFLPSEAQWEYAARGPLRSQYPWGDESPAPEKMRYAQHRRRLTYVKNSLPLSPVNDSLGVSPFGLHHMAGNVWQWCRDWYDEHFYQKPEARHRNPLNRTPAGARSERGGSWIGPAELCRSSFRRGRNPRARGRCLGFRCVSTVSDLRRNLS